MPNYRIQTKSENKQEGLDQAIKSFNQGEKEQEVAVKAKQLGLNYANLTSSPINTDALFIIPHEKAEKGRIVSFLQVGKRLRIGLQDPENETTKQVIDELQNRGYSLKKALVSAESIDHALAIYADHVAKKEQHIVREIDEDHLQSAAKEIQKLKNLNEDLKKMTASEGLNTIMIGAVKTNASDVHFQPEEHIVELFFRIDGILQKITKLDHHLYEQLKNQIKHDAKVKINVSNIPQDGEFHFELNDRRIDVRTSTLPTQYAETIVLRILDSKKGKVDFEQLGFEEEELDIIRETMQVPYGLILSTGPTGSGKTTTLYAMLNKLNTTEKKVVTLEDPVEYHIDGVAQAEIDEEEGFDFATGLKAALRQDPDIVMVGEMRDEATANTAVQAALTGHVVLSTLHTNTSIEAILRLDNLKVPRFLFTPATVLIIAQRLVRTVCHHCAEEIEPEKNDLDFANHILSTMPDHLKENFPTFPKKILRAKGCDKCGQTGYKGRTVVAEVLKFTQELRHAILENKETDEILKIARKGNMLLMEEDGLRKVFQKKTTFAELTRIIGKY